MALTGAPEYAVATTCTDVGWVLPLIGAVIATMGAFTVTVVLFDAACPKLSVTVAFTV